MKRASRTVFGSHRQWRELKALLDAQGWTCAYTGEPLRLGINASVDHIYPISRFPERAHDIGNLEWVCLSVNFMKKDRTRDEFLALLGHVLAYKGVSPDLAADLTDLFPVAVRSTGTPQLHPIVGAG